eukprot:6479795-Amphidinium_carterae.1
MRLGTCQCAERTQVHGTSTPSVVEHSVIGWGDKGSQEHHLLRSLHTNVSSAQRIDRACPEAVAAAAELQGESLCKAALIQRTIGCGQVSRSPSRASAPPPYCTVCISFPKSLKVCRFFFLWSARKCCPSLGNARERGKERERERDRERMGQVSHALARTRASLFAH